MELTDRQKQIMRLIADGCTTAEVADILGISQSTVADHKKRIYRKLRVDNAASAVRRCWEQGWLA